MSKATASASASGGIGFIGALALVLITLKLIGQINWSWWWVLAPLWAPWALLLVAACVYVPGHMLLQKMRRRRLARR